MASEYFSNALTKALGELESALTSATVVRVQAFLMLGLYKWSQPNGGLAAWIVEGGRPEESLPPWNQESTFDQLCKRVDDFYKHLPEDFTWSSANFWGHNDSVYISLHMLGAPCKIILHRECIPFIAIKCSKPTGPLGEFVSNTRTVLESFWERSAEQVFKAGREIIDLVSLCRDRLPHSSLVMFAIWQAASVETYSWHCPRMDTQSRMASKRESEERKSGGRSERVQTGIVSIALQALIKVAPFFSMASKTSEAQDRQDSEQRHQSGTRLANSLRRLRWIAGQQLGKELLLESRS
ncbi:hypothetical protein CaCOL14_013440 [Colletotrichum acutatum]